MRELIRETFKTKEDRHEFLLLLIFIPFLGAAMVAGTIGFLILTGR